MYFSETGLTWAKLVYPDTRRIRNGLQILAYVGDIVIQSRSIDEIEQTYEKLIKIKKLVGLEINKDKAKFMEIISEKTELKDLKVNVAKKYVSTFRDMKFFKQ